MKPRRHEEDTEEHGGLTEKLIAKLEERPVLYLRALGLLILNAVGLLYLGVANKTLTGGLIALGLALLYKTFELLVRFRKPRVSPAPVTQFLLVLAVIMLPASNLSYTAPLPVWLSKIVETTAIFFFYLIFFELDRRIGDGQGRPNDSSP